jgi:hypothetical protein
MNKQRITLAIACGVGMLATIMPWVNTPIGSFNGLDNNMRLGGAVHIGLPTFGLFTISLILAFLGNKAEQMSLKLKIPVGILGAISAAFGIFLVIMGPDQLYNRYSSIGFGIYLVILAGIGVCLTSFLFQKIFGK